MSTEDQKFVEYGVMFNDGSVARRWNGHTQQQRAKEYADEAARELAPDNITLARRVPGGAWERVLPPVSADQP